MSGEADDKPKSRRGGKRPGAGRKPKGHVPATKLGEIDLTAALEAPPPDDITALAQQSSAIALTALVKQLIHGKSEAAKVTAAKAILDRGYGKPAVDLGGDPMLPFAEKPIETGIDMRAQARKYATLAVDTLARIAMTGESESARVSAGAALLDRGLGTVAVAKVPDTLKAPEQPMGKREQMQRAASAAATGRFAVPAPPGGLN